MLNLKDDLWLVPLGPHPLHFQHPRIIFLVGSTLPFFPSILRTIVKLVNWPLDLIQAKSLAPCSGKITSQTTCQHSKVGFQPFLQMWFLQNSLITRFWQSTAHQFSCLGGFQCVLFQKCGLLSNQEGGQRGPKTKPFQKPLRIILGTCWTLQLLRQLWKR